MSNIELPITEKQFQLIADSQAAMESATQQASLIFSTILAGLDYPEGYQVTSVETDKIVMAKPASEDSDDGEIVTSAYEDA